MSWLQCMRAELAELESKRRIEIEIEAEVVIVLLDQVGVGWRRPSTSSSPVASQQSREELLHVTETVHMSRVVMRRYCESLD